HRYEKAMTALLMLALAVPAFGQSPEEDARRYMVRGMAAVEMAKTEDDLSNAAVEFKKAIEIAPNMAAAWYNLASVQSKIGQLKEAIESYQKYLALTPKAEDTQRVKDEITKLEYRMEQTGRLKSRGGTWVAEDGTFFQVASDGNRMTLVTGEYYLTKEEAESRSLGISIPVGGPVRVQYNLLLQGNRITGSRSRGAIKTDACTIPEDSNEVTGELREADHMMTLRYPFMKYEARTVFTVFSLKNEACAGVEAVEKKEAEKKFFGPLPQGGIGVILGGIHSYFPGGFSRMVFGWSGHLTIDQIEADSPAYAAGLRKGDEILAIDESPVINLSGSDAIRRLRGEPGTEVALSVKHKNGETATVRMLRMKLN
ncbi:MAG TPA: PDZ domain-containing protein, partial [Candidatus Deferrimicrobium sp.]